MKSLSLIIANVLSQVKQIVDSLPNMAEKTYVDQNIAPLAKKSVCRSKNIRFARKGIC